MGRFKHVTRERLPEPGGQKLKIASLVDTGEMLCGTQLYMGLRK